MKRTSNSSRRSFLQTALVGGTAAAITPLYPALGAARDVSPAAPDPAQSRASASETKPFELDEITIAELQAGLKSGKFTARSLTEKYLARIAEIDKRGPAVNAVIEVNPAALSIADELDRERQAKGARGPLHGVPLLIKDNIATHDRLM